MKKILVFFLKTVIVVLVLVVAGAVFLVFRWLFTREDPTAFLPEQYVAYVQVPSIRGLYDEWLNLEAADAVLSRPELAPYRRVVEDARGLALTDSPILGRLLEVQADVVLLKDRKLLAVLDLGWRGILTPLARIVGPVLRVKGFTFVSDSGAPMYRYTAGATVIHAALVNNIAVVSLDEGTVKQALERRDSRTGLAARASRELLDRVRHRSDRAVRVLADTQSLTADLVSGSELGARILDAMGLPGQSMLDVELASDRAKLSLELPVSIQLPELARALDVSPAPIGVLRYVPASASLLSVSNIAPLSDLYKIAAAFQGKEVTDLFSKADAGAKSVIGAGIDELLFSWIGAEMGAFMLPGSTAAIFFVRISDAGACGRALDMLTKSAVAGRDSSLVLDGVRLDRLAIPWYVKAILDTMGVDIPEPYFMSRGDYFFLSLEAENLATVAKAADTGDNLAHGSLYAKLSEGMSADASLLVWYDVERAEPFFIRGTGIMADVLRLYGRGVTTVRATMAGIRVALSAVHGESIGARLLPGFPLSSTAGVSGEILAFRFTDGGAPRLARIRDRSDLILAGPDGAEIARAKLETDSLIAPERKSSGAVSALWAVSPGGTVWRFGSKLEPLAPFPVSTGISGPMPPEVMDGKLALFSKADSALVLIGPDGSRSIWGKLEAPLFTPPDSREGRVTFYPKSFDAKIHLSDGEGVEAPGWPVQAAGISFCSPRIVASAGSFVVTFMTQAGSLHVWDPAGQPVPPFPIVVPGVFFATPEPILCDGVPALATLAQDGSLRLIGLDGAVLRQTEVADLDGKNARVCVADVDGDGKGEILLYGSGAFIAGYDSSLRPLAGFPVKGVTRPQPIDVNRDGVIDFVTAGMDGKVYAYTMGRPRR